LLKTIEAAFACLMWGMRRLHTTPAPLFTGIANRGCLVDALEIMLLDASNPLEAVGLDRGKLNRRTF